MMPPPGAPSAELLVARFRGHARRLFWSALILIGLFGATAYFYDNLPSPFENWMLLAAAGVILLVAVVIPYLVWLSRTYTLTTRRIIVNQGLGARQRREMSHVRGYSIAVRRGILQRVWGAGTITLSNGVDSPLRGLERAGAHRRDRAQWLRQEHPAAHAGRARATGGGPR